jgi:hypothetical protein
MDKNMNPAIKKFNNMFETFDNAGVLEVNRNQAIIIINYGKNLLKMYPHLNDKNDSAEVQGRVRALKSFCNQYDIEMVA